MIGPAGYGTPNFVADANTVLPYQIDFENAPTATAPAQDVAITDQLDPNLNWSTFELTGIRWGDTILSIPRGSQSYQTSVSMTFNGETFDVDVEAGIHVATGQVFVLFQSIDPNTELPPDVLTGFLPPEDGTGRGEGYISFSISPIGGLATGTQIRNVALVTFDENGAIATDQVNDDDPSQGVDPNKQALVTIDSGAPTSAVAPLPAVSSTNAFTVNWAGTDDAGGSGIASYTIYVSDDEGPFTSWLPATTLTSATFMGQDGHTYAFISIATDNVGNTQPTPTAAQATTTVDATPPTSTVAPLPSYSPGSFTVSWLGSDSNGIGIADYDVYVSDNGSAFVPWLSDTTQTSATYTGQDGHAYGFYSVATDNLGNTQPTPSAAQATTVVDSVPPSSAVAPLPAFSPGTFAISWSGSDNPGGSGLADYSIYVSDDGAPFAPLLTDTTLTSTTFTGSDGHTYSFFSFATDNVGNVQSTPTAAQATTTVDTSPPTSSVSALPQFSPSSFLVSWSGSDGSGSGIADYDIYVSTNGGPFAPLLTGTVLTSTMFNGTAGDTYGFYSVATDAVGNVQPTPDGAQASTTVIAATSTAVSVSPDSVSYSVNADGTVTLTADVTSSAGTVGEGTVDFVVAGIGSVDGVAVADGAASTAFTVPMGTLAGDYGVSASYEDTGGFGPSSGSGTLTVSPAATTTTAGSGTALFGDSTDPVTLSAAVSSAAGPVGEGTVTFTILDQFGDPIGQPIPSGPVTAGTATADFTPPSGLSAGTYTIEAAYNAGPDFQASQTSGAANGTLTVQPASPTFDGLSAPSIVYGESPVTVSGHLSGNTGLPVPAGETVQITLGSATQSATLDANDDFSTSFAVDTLAASTVPYAITFAYAGDGNFNAASGASTLTVGQDGTTTSVKSSANPSAYGQSVTFTATVLASAPGGGTPTGTVTFLDGTVTLGQGTLSGGVATFMTSLLASGTHTITAGYGGDTDFTASGSASLSQVVGVGTSTALTSSVNPSVYGQAVTFTATVTQASGTTKPTGTVTFYDGMAVLGTANLSSGKATFKTSTVAVGSQAITASYGGSGTFAASTSAVLVQTVNQDGTTTALSTSVDPSVFGQKVTFTATVSAVAPGTGKPSGAVTFLNGSTVLGTGTLSGGKATFSSTTLTPGSYSITASYGGDGNFSGSGTTGLAQTVNQDASTVKVSSSKNPSVFGQGVTFTTTVAAAAPGAGTPTGTVEFLDGSTVLDTATLATGKASFNATALTPGGHSITVIYSGDDNFTGNTSTVLSQIVNQAASASKVTSSAATSVYGQTVTLTATVTAVSPGVGTPTGSVTFLDGNTVLGSGPLSGGKATFVTNALAVGNHPVTISYSGDTNFTANTSPVLTQTVNEDASIVAVTSSVNPSVFGQTVTFTATVTAKSPGAGTPTGSVSFLDGNTVLYTTMLGSGTATCTTSALSVGSHSITVQYSGDGNFTAGKSSARSQVVNQAATATALSSSLNPSTLGQSVTFTAIVSVSSPGVGIPSGSVTFKNGSATLATVPLDATGTATYTISTLSVGSHAITASYTATTNFKASNSTTLTEVVNAMSPGVATASGDPTAAPNAVATAALNTTGLSDAPLLGTLSPVPLGRVTGTTLLTIAPTPARSTSPGAGAISTTTADIGRTNGDGGASVQERVAVLDRLFAALGEDLSILDQRHEK